MYYKLPVKERIELMKSYRKANPDMSYQDMVNDYNTSYKKFGNGGKKQQTKTDLYTDKALFDKAYKAEQDSLYKYKEFQKYIKDGYVPVAQSQSDAAKDFRESLIKRDKEKNINNYYYHPASGLDPNGVNWKYETIAYLGTSPKKPVVHNVYEPVMTKPIQSSQDTVRHWNFNGPTPVLEYYDKSSKLINKEFYTNAGPGGKRIQPLTNYKYGGIQQFDNGGKKERKPIITHNKNDPRLRVYNDSLNLYLEGVEKLNFWKKYPGANNETLNKIESIIDKKYPISSSEGSFGSNMINATGWEIIGKGTAKRGVPQYKKPVQPYKYEPEPENPPSEPPPPLPLPLINPPPIKKDTIQDSVKYLPLIKTIPTLTDSIKQPKIIQSTLKQPEQKSTYQKVSFRYDPVSKLQVPVLLTDPKMKVEQGTRIYNKYIPTVTGALPLDFKPEFNKAEVYEKTDPYWRSKFINPNSGVKK